MIFTTRSSYKTTASVITKVHSIAVDIRKTRKTRTPTTSNSTTAIT